jgi:hypothetical protein
MTSGLAGSLLPVTRSDLLHRLQLHFNRQGVDDALIDDYLRELEDVPVKVLDVAVEKLIEEQTQPWFPTLGLILQTCAEVKLGLPVEHEALGGVDGLVEWARGPNLERDERPPAVHPLVRQALRQVGGTAAFRSSEAPAVIRGQFVRAYRELRAAEILKAQRSPRLTAKIREVSEEFSPSRQTLERGSPPAGDLVVYPAT